MRGRSARRLPASLALISLALAACAASAGGASVAPVAATTTTAAPPGPSALPVAPIADDSFARHVHEPKLRIGHYSSGDGMTGFVLDRTGPRPKIRMDGGRDVLVLEARPAPLDQTDLVEDGFGARLRLGRRGDVTYFRGPRGDSVPVARDADAEPLP